MRESPAAGHPRRRRKAPHFPLLPPLTFAAAAAAAAAAVVVVVVVAVGERLGGQVYAQGGSNTGVYIGPPPPFAAAVAG